MKGKHIICLLVIVAILVGWLYLVKTNNEHWNESMEGRKIGKEYSLGEEVPLGESIVNKQAMRGYMVKVTNFEIVGYDDFLKENGYMIDNPYEIPYEKLGLVYITITNEDADTEDFPIINLRLTTLDSCQYINKDVLMVCNESLPETLMVSLKQHSSIDLLLPYDLFYDSLGADWNRLEKTAFYLRIATTPEELNIKIQ